MYSKFKYTPTHYFYNKELNPHLEKGKEIYNHFESQARKSLKDFIYQNGQIDGSALKEHWFKIEKADVFLSHSHKDITKVAAFAGWLYNTFGLTSFIDSCSWGYCDDLLKEIDDEYCKNKSGDTYNYQLRNYTTSHVHMMLSSALSQMIDNTECIIFFDTPNSIVLKDELDNVKKKDKKATLSPWIYHELSMSTMIRTTLPSRRSVILEHSSGYSFDARSQLNIQYDVSEYLRNMTPLTESLLLEWKDSLNTLEVPLDTLYKIIKEKNKSNP